MTFTKKQLLTGNMISQLVLGGIQVERAGLNQARKRAQELDYFYDQDNYVIQQILRSDLLKYMDGFDITRMKHITIDTFIPAFLKKICNVYDNPPSILLKDESKNKFKVEMEKLNDLMNEVRLISKMAETFEKMRLHNTVTPYIKYNKSQDRVIIDTNYNIGTSFVVPEQYDSLTMLAFAYEQMDDNHKVTWGVWDKGMKQHYILRTSAALPNYNYGTGFEGKKIAIGDNTNYEMPNYDGDYCLPFVTYQYKNHNNAFWGNGMYFLADLVRSINILLTVINDDSIQETIRLLILNFDPTGAMGEKGQIKSGMRQPIFPESRGVGSDNKAEADIVSADLYNKDVLELIDKLVDIAASLHNVESPIKTQLEQSLSGIALKLKTEPLLRNWSHDINILRYADMELLKKIILVNNYHRKGKSNMMIKPELIDHITIKYAEPTIVSDDKADYELEQTKFKDGTSSPIQYVMKQDPTLSEEDAKALIQKNLDDTKALTKPDDTQNPFSFTKKE